ncbi:TIGR01459 family HAD-type hydrolase [Candidatus Sneabacter namystus]|uniref:TIGR01459 family HAD-type hydrolase n=1 Tax=Candidatus Sneabacter namystus TaxID=2601646 RepID=A0A5C0UK49_9RICK|nr:TIGR01459 family HAD-type hydrolase [Candidatus Sneabacter namystus]QEK39812.1 TIGR01459 family HAD-type hydrolase [Candidatus Sneabacter namystus]
MVYSLDKVLQITDLSKHYDAILFDVWGVILDETESILPSVVDTINTLIKEKYVYFVSNAPIQSNILAKFLLKEGINVSADHVITSGQMSRDLLFDPEYQKSIFGCTKSQVNIYRIHYDSPYRCLFDDLAVNYVEDIAMADLILVTVRSQKPEVECKEIVTLYKKALQLNVPVLCVNPDLHVRGKDGNAYCSGYFSNLYKEMGGRVFFIGKPYPAIYNKVFISGGLSKEKHKVLMVGDTLTTDIKGGIDVGISTALVLTGNVATAIGQDSQDVDVLHKVRLHCQLHDIFPNYLVSLL